MHNLKGYAHTAVIGDVLAYGKFSVNLAAVKLNSVELLNHILCKFFEGIKVFFKPPVFKITVLIEVGTVIVKSMRNLMADYRTDTAEILTYVLRQRVEGLL